MDFDIPADIAAYLRELDDFIEREIRPLERENDNIRFFDHRREHARTDWDNDGQPRHEWEELLAEMRRRADKAGHLRFAPAQGTGRQGRLQPRHGDHPRASRPQGARPAQRPAERELDRRQLPGGAAAAPLRHQGAEGALSRGHVHRQGAHRLRAHRAQPWLGRHLHGDHGGQAGRRLGDQRHEAVQHRHAHRHGRPGLRPHLGQAGRCARHLRLPGAGEERRASRSSTCGGPSTCRRTTPRSRSPTSRCRPRPCWARKAAGSTWRRPSCTRTASARPLRASARRNTASTCRSPMPRTARCSARPWPPTRRSSSRWPSCTPRPR